MTLSYRIYIKFYYKLLSFLIPSRQIHITNQRNDKKYIFLYFDYEREFSGLNTFLNDHELDKVLDILKKNNVSATWFTVGEIFNKYPYSINSLIASGQEIASHTFNHLAPKDTTRNKLKNDFHQYSGILRQYKIIGFHSPQGKWSLRQLNLLHKYSFKYDLIDNKRKKDYRVQMINWGFGKRIIRFQTIGDDWKLYNNAFTKESCIDYFNTLLKNMNMGDTGGIGFHPWILFSDSNIFEAFKDFIKELSNRRDFQIVSISELLSGFSHD